MCYCGSPQCGRQAGPIKSCLEIRTQRTAGYLCYRQAADSKWWRRKKKKKPSLGGREQRKTTEQRVGWKKMKQIWPLKTDCSAVLSWSRCAGIHNSTQGLIQFFGGKKGNMIKNPGPGADRFLLLLRPRRHLLFYFYYKSAHTALANACLAPLQPLGPQECWPQKSSHRGSGGRCCPVDN